MYLEIKNKENSIKFRRYVFIEIFFLEGKSREFYLKERIGVLNRLVSMNIMF